MYLVDLRASARNGVWLFIVAVFLIGISNVFASEGPSQEEFVNLRKQTEELRALLNEKRSQSAISRVDSSIANRYGPDARIQTGQGALRIGGLLQVWAYTIQNDSLGYTDAAQILVGAAETASRNEEADNDSLRVRRAELRFDLDIHENISAHVMLDFAREATGFPGFPHNQASRNSGGQSMVFFDPCLCAEPQGDPRQIGAGTGDSNRILQDAYINVHDWVPHHDITFGQFKRRLGLEGSLDSGKLKFAERAMVSQPGDLHDLGLQFHGSWLDERVQYWVGLFNGAGSAFQARANRSDDNDDKDLLLSLEVTPVKEDPTWGTLNLGFTLLAGMAGESGGHLPGTNPVDGLNRRRTARFVQQAWAQYRPGGPVKGWWVSGEWARHRDRLAPSESESGLKVVSIDPGPITFQGWYFATGYHLGKSVLADELPKALRKLEVLFRYEAMENLLFHDLSNPERRFDLFTTQVFTAGINYYLKGHYVKAQLNYNWVLEDDHHDQDDRQLREVRNNTLLLNLQIMF